jgi:hypothetical protein
MTEAQSFGLLFADLPARGSPNNLYLCFCKFPSQVQYLYLLAFNSLNNYVIYG